MAITLVTGLPGHGKTLYALQEVESLRQKSGRPVYYSGIPELSLPWVEMSDSENWHQCEDGAIIVIDEAQRVFRPAGPGQKISPSIAMFETHRHRGHDVFLITQHPNLVHSNVRRLVDRHLHVFRGWGLQEHTVYDWPECQNPNSDAVKKSCSNKKTVRFKRDVFHWYKSSAMHTVQRHLPWRLLVFVGLAVIVCVGGVVYAVLNTYGMMTGNNSGGQVVESSPSVKPAEKTKLAVPVSVASAPLVMDAPAMAKALTPIVPGIPASAPLYQSKWLQVASVPVVAGCLVADSGCRCYTQQGTRADVPDSICRAYVDRPAFNHMKPDQVPAAPEPSRSESIATQQDAKI